MRAIELLYERTLDMLGIRDLINKADSELSGEAARAITDFVGHEPGKVDQDDLDDMTAFGFMNYHTLEQGELAKEIEHAFAPVREKLKSMLGDTVTLYRTQHDIADTTKARKYLSWTSDKLFAKAHAGIHRKGKPLYTEQDIKKFEREFKQNGEVKIIGTNYTLKLEHMKMRNMQGKVVEFDSIDIYQGNQHITDTESVSAFVNGINKDRIEHEAENKEKMKKIFTATVSLDDVIWVTDRAGQSEFIVRNDPSSSAYIDIKGLLH